MDSRTWDAWMSDWAAVVAGVLEKGEPATASPPLIKPPMPGSDVADLNGLGIELPSAFADVCRSRSSRVAFHWRLFDLDGDAQIDAPMFGTRTPKWGGCHAADSVDGDSRGSLWDVAQMAGLRETHNDWLDNCFLGWLAEDPEDVFARPWMNKLPFIEVGDGDMIAFDLAPESHGQVVYLCHDDACSVIHGKALGSDFVDFMTRWSRVGCVGPEGWFLELFWDETACEFAAADSPIVNEWRSWLGMAGGG
jgi:hypothetical protein